MSDYLTTYPCGPSVFCMWSTGTVTGRGKELKNQLVKELQTVFDYKETRTTPYRPRGNSALERIHSTMHNMSAVYCVVAPH